MTYNVNAMSKLSIKNIGAIKNVEFDVNRINVFMGPQSSGKSTISKILCHCQWVEKSCFLNKQELEYYQKPGVFFNSLVEYHKLEGYFNRNASIKYVGDYFTLTYTHSSKRITIKLRDKAAYAYPKISYIPSERNFVTGVSNFGKYNEGNNVILYFGYDWSEAKRDITRLDISQLLNREVVYENLNGQDYIFDHGSKIQLVNASSGVQSILPLYQTILYMLSNVYTKARTLSPSKEFAQKQLYAAWTSLSGMVKGKKNSLDNDAQHILLTVFNSLKQPEVKAVDKLSKLTSEELDKNVSEASALLNKLFDYHFTQLFIEEPEQNLFPDTQQEFVYWLIENLSKNERKHAVVLTTHSPYILFALNNCMMGGLVKNNIPLDEAENFPSHAAWIEPHMVSVFEIEDGSIRRIQDKDGIIEDNYLNKAYKRNSEEYLSLLNYYEDEE